MTIRSPQDVLDFWFSDEMKPWWFQKSDDIDQQITEVFAATYEAAHAGRLDHWLAESDDALALIITLDQLPRNMFRGHGKAFQSGDLAVAHAREAVERGHDRQQPTTRRQFFYLPFMHSEDIDDQDRSVRLYEALGNPHSLHFAREHRDIVARFGRFPHRNAALERENTSEETLFLKTHSGF